jgi:hypothetical protein
MGTALSLVERNACVIGMFDWWITLRMADKMLQNLLGGGGAAHGCPKA